MDAPDKTDDCFIDELEIMAHYIIPTNQQMISLKEAQKQDAVCREGTRLCIESWPVYMTDANQAIHPYWDAQAHLTVNDDLMLYNNRVVIPIELRLTMLEKIHQAHQGIVKCRASQQGNMVAAHD